MKHDDQIDTMDTMQPYTDESNQQKNTNAPLPIKRFPLRNIPLYHAHYHQHTYNLTSSDLSPESPRNRSSIRKRASSEKLSTNITMVLEGLLQ